MNAVIALCHFCELHGPSVVFCTQSYHDDSPEELLNCTAPQDDHKLEPDERPCYGSLVQYLRSNSLGGTSSSSGKEVNRITAPKISDTCEACRSVPIGQFGYISNDHEARVSYVSSQYPCHPEVFSAVRQACVQSLSCEVCVGREGPIFFGDELHGYVISYTFFLRDSQARGLQRWYSIIVLMMDKVFLLSSWPFLVKELRTVISSMQQKANKLYDSEQVDCPQRALRLNSVTSMTPGDFRRQRGSSKAMRPLAELTGDGEVFASLHSSFTWILKAGAGRLVERTLEGNMTEDTVIDMEKQEETEEGFMMVSTKRVPVEYQKVLSTVEYTEAAETEARLVDSDQLAWFNVRHVCKALGEDRFRLLFYHVVTGDQVIVRCQHKALAAQIINSLKMLIPRGCFRPIYYSAEYMDAWRCNFLGLPLGVTLPAHVVSSPLHVQLLVTSQLAETQAADPESLMSDLEIALTSIRSVPERVPTVMTKIERAILNPSLSDSVLESFCVSLKEEWMNKVKVVFKFSRSGSRSVEDTHSLLGVLGAHEADKQVLKFWMTGLSSHYKSHVLSAPMSQCLGNEGVS